MSSIRLPTLFRNVSMFGKYLTNLRYCFFQCGRIYTRWRTLTRTRAVYLAEFHVCLFAQCNIKHYLKETSHLFHAFITARGMRPVLFSRFSLTALKSRNTIISKAHKVHFKKSTTKAGCH